jgi:hypothetical protein
MECGGGLDEFAERAAQVAVLKLIGGKPTRDQAGVLDRAVDAQRYPVEAFAPWVAITCDFFGCLDGKMNGGEFLANAVVEIVPDAALFALTDANNIALQFPRGGGGLTPTA